MSERGPEEVRQLLSECEIAVTRLEGAGEGALTLLHSLDRIAASLDQLEEQGLDVRPERTRLETVVNQLHSRAPVLLRELRVVGGLAKARETAQCPEAAWWRLDEKVRAERRRTWRRRLLAGAAIAAILAILLGVGYRWLSQRTGGPVQQTLAGIEQTASLDGDLEAALQTTEALVAEAPNEPEAWLWLGTLHAVLDHPGKAESAFARARALYESSTDYLLARSVISLRMERVEDALATAEKAVAQAPGAAEAHLVLGNVYDAQGRIQDALEAFEAAAALAQEAGQSGLVVSARMRYGQLLMSLGQELSGTVTPQDNTSE